MNNENNATKTVKGFKVFNPDWTCRNFQYEVGETFKHDGDIELCEGGFHFCKEIADCFKYYKFDPRNKVAEVEALGNVFDGDDKSVTNELHIIREISWEEMLHLANSGKGNTGLRNSGYGNSGNWNSGYGNSGYGNSGNWNSGNWNSGDWNSGDRNSGDWNSSNGNAGCFNTEEHTIMMFDKPSNITLKQWIRHRGRNVLNAFNYSPVEWISESQMTDEEKEKYPTYKTTGGYLKQNPKTQEEEFQDFWNNLNATDKAAVLDIPNFDAVKFKQITGVDVHK